MGLVKLQINANIFQKIMSFGIENKSTGLMNFIDLPCGANFMYLQSISNTSEQELLRKYCEGTVFQNSDYDTALRFLINTTTRIPTNISQNSPSFLASFGIEIDQDAESGFRLIEESIPALRVDTWDCIFIDKLRPYYTDIIECFDFGNYTFINLTPWKSELDEVKQSLMTALRVAYSFTLIAYVYREDSEECSLFIDFFENEFYKRVSLIHALWTTKSENQKIQYLPLFDSFYNLDENDVESLSKVLRAIFSSENVALDDIKMFKNRLVEGADSLHRQKTSRSSQLENSLIKPLVNCLIEMEKANDDLMVAISLSKQKSFNKSVSCAYYSMMHAAKALLEKNGKLANWDANMLNVNESHSSIANKLKQLLNSSGNNALYKDFQYVKSKRWLSDYSLTLITIDDSVDCISKSTKFLEYVQNKM